MNENINLKEDTEIKKALEEFELDYVKENIKPVKNITTSKDAEYAAFSRIVIKLSNGLIKDERHAEYVLLGFACVAFTISMYLFFN